MIVFSDAERSVFKYTLPDGSVRHIDPLAIERELDARCGGDLNAVLELVAAPAWELAGPATAKLARVVCATFRLGQPFDETTGQGVPYEDWCNVLNWFITEREKNVSPAANSATCSRPTEADPADPLTISPTANCIGI